MTETGLIILILVLSNGILGFFHKEPKIEINTVINERSLEEQVACEKGDDKMAKDCIDKITKKDEQDKSK